MKRLVMVFLAVLALMAFPSSALAMDPTTEKVVNVPTITLAVIGGAIGTLGGPVGIAIGASLGAGLGVADVATVCADKQELKGYPCTSENGPKE